MVYVYCILHNLTIHHGIVNIHDLMWRYTLEVQKDLYLWVQGDWWMIKIENGGLQYVSESWWSTWWLVVAKFGEILGSATSSCMTIPISFYIWNMYIGNFYATTLHLSVMFHFYFSKKKYSNLQLFNTGIDLGSNV